MTVNVNEDGVKEIVWVLILVQRLSEERLIDAAFKIQPVIQCLLTSLSFAFLYLQHQLTGRFLLADEPYEQS